MAAPRNIVVIGGGQAGGWTARTLRDEGFDGSVVLIGAERHPPHERPPLSKAVLLGEKPPEITHLFPGNSYDQLAIELRLGNLVTSIDARAKNVRLDDGEIVPFDLLMLAMGGRPRELPVPGTSLAGVHMLRTIDDSLALGKDLKSGCSVLVVGGGWIGLEVAAAARKKNCQVTVIEALDRLCARGVAPDVSEYLLTLHRGHGVDVRLNIGLASLEGVNHLTRAVLSDGSTLQCDVAVIGIGMVPNVELAKAAGLAVDNGIVVDGLGCTSHPDIYAAGDLANRPSARLGRRVRLESWENAQNQAITAAKAMLGKTDQTYDDVPWFWSDQYGVNLQLLGLAQSWEQRVTRGRTDKLPYVAFYLTRDQIEGALGLNAGRDMRFVRRLMTLGKQVGAGQLGDPAVKLQDLARP